MLAKPTFPTGTTGGQAGFVFGYKGGADYWLRVTDATSPTTYKAYHVLNGTRTKYDSHGSDPFTIGSVFNTWAISTHYQGIRDAKPIFGSGSGYPSGRVGLYATVAGTTFGQFKAWNDATSKDTLGRWVNTASGQGGGHTVSTSTSRLSLNSDYSALPRPQFVRNLRLGKFQATFPVQRDNGGTTTNVIGFAFDGTDPDDYDYVTLFHSNTATAPSGYKVAAGQWNVTAGGTTTLANVPTLGTTDVLWCRVTYDGTTLTVMEQKSATEPTTWTSGTMQTYSSTGFRGTGGLVGFLSNAGSPSVAQATVYSYNSSTSAYDKLEQFDNFAVDTNAADATFGMSTGDTLTNDSNGNLTYDGTVSYTYDGWNRLKTVAHASRDSAGTLEVGQTLDVMAYDAKGRRISKTVTGTGQWDGRLDYYLDQDSVVEEQNGSALTVKQFVWGQQYIDELVQASVNSNPSTSHQTCDTGYWACQDANWNVLGVLTSAGVLQERYEYAAYGQRTVYYSAGSNDPAAYTPTLASKRVVTSGSVTQFYGLCEVGHQGLQHDEEVCAIYDRARYIAERFLSRDESSRGESANLEQYESSNPIRFVDPSGHDIESLPLPLPVQPPGGSKCTLYKCTRKSGIGIGGSSIGRHAYLWFSCPASADNGGCAMWRSSGSSGGGGTSKDPRTPWDQSGDNGPGTPGHTCFEVANAETDGMLVMENVMDCCHKDWDSKIWFPYISDCHNHTDDCLKKSGFRPPRGSGRF